MVLKWVAVVVLLGLLAVSAYLLFNTERGQKILDDPRKLAADVHAIVRHHRFTAPLIFLVVYIVVASLGILPVWWMQIFAGIGFGLVSGAFWSLVGATVSAALTVRLSRWIAGDWFHSRVESRMERLRKLDRTLGHNGFLVVMTTRLIHLLPFGLCNYALGLIDVSMPDVILGTFLGSIPAVGLYVGMGSGHNPRRDWKFVAVLATLNVLLLLPLAARYLRPQWFRKLGVQ